MELNNKKKMVWDKSRNCNCGKNDCKENHRICILCGKLMVYSAHEENQMDNKFIWNIGHIVPVSKGGTEDLDNLIATHVICNSHKKQFPR